MQSNPISRETARKWINGQSLPSSPRLKTLISWLDLDASFIYATSITEENQQSLNSFSQRDARKLEVYTLRKKEGLGQAALNFISPLTAILDKDGFIILIDEEIKSIKSGILGDIAPTILELMGVEQPKEMTRKSLL